MKHTAVFSTLSDPGLLKISGVDAKKLLQGQLTCDLEKITAQTGSLAAHCNPQGRIISLFYLFLYKDAYYLLMSRDMVTIAMTALKKFAVFYKTTLTDNSDDMACISYTSIELHEKIKAANLSIALTTSKPRYIALGTKEIIQSISSNITQTHDWNYLNICDGIPAIYPETTEKFLPHDLNLTHLGAVSFDKGCYTGQEIIARMQYRGKLKNQLFKATAKQSTTPLPGSEFYNLENQTLKPCGNIVDAIAENADHQRLLILTDTTNATNPHLFLDQQQQAPLNILGEPE